MKRLTNKGHFNFVRRATQFAGLSAILLVTLALAMPTSCFGQPPEGGPPSEDGPQGRRGGRGERRGPGGPPDHRPGGPGEGQGHMRPPHHPLMRALDTDEDGELSSVEIANATMALQSLDQDEDGRLTYEELRPPRGLEGAHGQGARGREGRDGSRGGRDRGQRGVGRESGRPPGPPGRRPPLPPMGEPRGERGARGGTPPFNAEAFADHILRFDRNDDKKISADELPERMRSMVQQADSDGDELISRDELMKLADDPR